MPTNCMVVMALIGCTCFDEYMFSGYYLTIRDKLMDI